MSDTDKIKEGDVVRLKSGGALMSVAGVVGEVATCFWMTAGQLDHAELRLSILRKDQD